MWTTACSLDRTAVALAAASLLFAGGAGTSKKTSVLAGSGRAHSTKDKNGTCNDIVQLDAQRPLRQFHALLEKAEHLFMANVVAG